MTPRCENCAYWTGRSPDFGTCNKAESTHEGRTMLGPPTKAVAVPIGPDGGRFTAPNTFAVLETAHDFGCVQFEARR